MKATINQSDISNNLGIEKVHFRNQEISNEAQIVDYFENPENGQLIISLYSHLFAENQQKIYIRENKLIIIVSELIHTYKSNSVYVSDWQSFCQQSYVRMRNISLFLPGDDFYILRHYLVPEKFLLNIIIGKLVKN
jgi:hypothetical protein